MMRTTDRAVLLLAAAVIATWCVGARGVAAAPQEGLPPEVERMIAPQDPAGLEEQLRQLFAKVERSLRRIDDMLFEAGAGDPLEEDLDSGLGELLDRTLEQSRSTIEDMNRILEIAQQLSQQQQQQGGSGSGSGDQQQESSGSSPLDGRSPPRQGQEQTPERPDQQLDPSQQGGEQPQGQRPDDGGEGGPESQQRGEAPARRDGQPATPGRDSDPWGDLPPRVQQIFRTQGGQDMPPAYRGWIDAYHRRLGRTR